MIDYAHDKTECVIEDLEAQIVKVFSQVAKDMDKDVAEFFEWFADRNQKYLEKLEAGEISESDYKRFISNQLQKSQRFQTLRNQLAEAMTSANEMALAAVNDARAEVYAVNRNYAEYETEKIYGSTSFTLWDASTVQMLAANEPDLMPNYPKELAVKRGIDLAYGKKKITEVVTSGILRGTSIPKTAKELMQAIPTMTSASAIRAARTAMTSAQNAGRQDSYKAAQDMGLKLQKRWVATKDSRTRKRHRKMDGETVGLDEKFSNGMRYPGDRTGKPEDVYNCRCTMRTVEPEGIEAEPRMMRARDPKTGENVLIPEMTYEQWEKWKESGGDTVGN